MKDREIFKRVAHGLASGPHDPLSRLYEYALSQGVKVDQVRPLPAPVFTSEGVIMYPLSAISPYVDLSIKRLQQLVWTKRVSGVKPGNEWFGSLEDILDYAYSPKNKGGRPKKIS